jgi:heme/copper-type cytochrome/quinol oxidase subunit 3
MVKWTLPAAACGIIAIGAMLRWGWELDRGAKLAPVDIGGGIRLPLYASGPLSQAWWAVIILILVIGTTYACLVFSYFYMWTVRPELWPADASKAPWTSAAFLLASSAALAIANRGLKHVSSIAVCGALGAAVVLMLSASALELHAHRAISPSESSYGALVQTFVAFNGVSSIAVSVLALYAAARRNAGLLDHERRNVFDCVRLLWHYVVGQNLAGLALVHGFPKWAQQF